MTKEITPKIIETIDWNQEIVKKEREWYGTEIGSLFVKFEDMMHQQIYLLLDLLRCRQTDNFQASDRRLQELHNESGRIRQELLTKIRGW